MDEAQPQAKLIGAAMTFAAPRIATKALPSVSIIGVDYAAGNSISKCG
jgi:hypothetical protein